jgi:hypothetical protein
MNPWKNAKKIHSGCTYSHRQEDYSPLNFYETGLYSAMTRTGTGTVGAFTPVPVLHGSNVPGTVLYIPVAFLTFFIFNARYLNYL